MATRQPLPRHTASSTQRVAALQGRHCRHAPAERTLPFPTLNNLVQEASIGQAPPLTDEAMFEHLHKTAKHLDHEFREANKRALLNVVSGRQQLQYNCSHALLNVVSGRQGMVYCCPARRLVEYHRPARCCLGHMRVCACRDGLACGYQLAADSWLSYPAASASTCRCDFRHRLLCYAQPAGAHPGQTHKQLACTPWLVASRGAGLWAPSAMFLPCLRLARLAAGAPRAPQTPACSMPPSAGMPPLLRVQVPQRQILFRTFGRIFTGLSDTSKAFLIILITGALVLLVCAVNC